MSRTIAVKGVGSLRLKPDYVVIGLELEAKDEVYERAMSLSSERIDELTKALTEVGFGKDELKTTGFHVRADYRSEQNDKGNYVQVFDGYVCHTSLKLSFDLEMQKLGETISAIGSCRGAPEMNISFTVKEPASRMNARTRSMHSSRSSFSNRISTPASRSFSSEKSSSSAS